MTTHYVLALPDCVRHLLDVTVEVQNITTPEIDLVLPAWTPGSYMIREYARQVQEFRAETAEGALEWRKIEKARWRITTGGATTLRVHYRLYGYELTVRTNHVDATHAHVIPAATFMFVDGQAHEPLTVTVEPPQGWEVATGLACTSTTGPWPGAGSATFKAADFDELVDSPFEIGTHRTLNFTVDEKPHRIVIWGRGNEDEARLLADTQRIVETERDLWGGLPYDHYTFFVLLAGKAGGGGLEHRNSTSLLLPRFIFQPGKGYERVLGLIAHEFFHTWNVKRLRAAELGPFDYTTENYTKLLWAMEGVTEYYTDLLLLRAGLLTPTRYLERVADDIETLQATPGRALQSLECASFDAWIKFYRPDENTANTGVSYYLKGALVALLLDLEIRRQTANQQSLDDVMQWLYAKYPADGPGMPENGYQQAIQAVSGLDLQPFFDHYIAGVSELPFAETFAAFGISAEWSHKALKPGSDQPRPSLGLRTKQDQGLYKVATVLSDGPAAAAGLSPDDELLAFNGYRITDDATLHERLAERQPGDGVEITVARREELQTISVTLAAAAQDALKLKFDPAAKSEQIALRDSWLKTS